MEAGADTAFGEVGIGGCRLLQGEVVRDGDEVLELRRQAADAIEIESGQLDAGDVPGAQPCRLLLGRGKGDFDR